MNILELISGADHDTITDGKWDGETLKKKAYAFVAFNGAVVTEIKDVNKVTVTKNYITDSVALPASFLGSFDTPISSITVTGTVAVYGIKNHKY